MAAFAGSARAGDWTVKPRLTLAESYLDNVTLAPSGKEQWDMITEVNPGVEIDGRGARVRGHLNYQLQNLVSLRNSDRNNTYQQLSATGDAELTKNWFYLDAKSSIRQSIISATAPISADNLHTTNNRTNVYTYTLSPYMRHNFGGWVNSLLRYTHQGVNYATGAADANINAVQARLSGGRRFSRLGWSLDYQKKNVNRTNAFDARYESSTANVRYRLTDTVSLLGQAGYENNKYRSSRNIQNGSYWGAGLGWTPSRHFSAQALKGDRFETASVTVSPSPRTSMTATYRKRGVGLNPGVVWSGTARLATRNTSWQAKYLESTTTVQQLSATRLLLVGCIDALGQPVPYGSPDAVVCRGVPIDLLSLTNEEIVRKRGSLTAGFKTAKSGFRVTLFDERREYQLSNVTERTKGARTSWNWRFSGRTRSLMSLNWQRTHFLNRQGDYWVFREALIRRISPKLTSALEYQHTTRTTDQIGGDYDSNRVTARVTMYF